MCKKLKGIMALAMALVCFAPSVIVNAEEVAPVTEAIPAEVAPVEVIPTEYVSPETQLYNQTAAEVSMAQATRQLVFIGDSRTVGMKSAVGKDGNIWSAKIGMGYSWMKSTGVPQVEASINSNTDVVILMGVNDVRSLSYTSKYASYINEKAATWTALGASVYYVSVNPMAFETSSYPGITNSVIESWNSKMKSGLSANVTYIDTYSQVLGKVSSSDGIHYSRGTYKTIYSLIGQSILSDKTEKAYAAALAASQLAPEVAVVPQEPVPP